MTRLWLRSSVLLLCLVQLIVTSKISQAGERASGEKLFPKETLAFFTISNVPELKKKWDKSSMGQMLHDAKLQSFLDDVKKKIDEGSKQVEGEIGVSLDALLELPQGELSLAVMEQPARKFGFVLVLEFGDKQETVDKLLEKMAEELKNEEAEHSTEEVEDVTLHIYSLKEDDDNPFKTLTYFVDEKCLVFSNEVAAIKEVLERWDGDSDDTLAQNDQFSYIMNQCKPESGEPLVKMFLNPIGLINTGVVVVQDNFPQFGQLGMAVGFLPILGLDAMKGWGGTFDFDEGEYEGIANLYFYCDSSRGLLGLFNLPATQLTPSKWVPSSVGSYTILNWNVSSAYTAIESLYDQFQGKGSTARFLDQQAGSGPMIHIKKDVLDHLDGKIQVIQSVSEAAQEGAPPIPDYFVAFGLKDATKMKKTLAAAAKASGPAMETREFNGEKIYDVQIPGSPNSFSFAVSEGQLVITNDTPMLENMMRGQTAQRASLVDSAEYKRIAKLFPSKASALVFQRADATLKVYYNLLKGAKGDFLDGVDPSKLPPFEALSKYFQASGGYSVPDKKGIKSVSYTLKRSE